MLYDIGLNRRFKSLHVHYIATGNQTRYCDENGIWDDPSQVGCVSEEFLMLADMADGGGVSLFVTKLLQVHT